MKYPFPIFEYPTIIQDSPTIFVYKTVGDTPISLKDVNSGKIIGEKACIYQILFVPLQHQSKTIKNYSNMKVYIITYSWFNEMAGSEDGVYDVFLDLDQATKKFNEMVKEDAKSFKEDVCAGVEVHETTRTNEDGSRYVYYGNDLDEFYSATLHIKEVY